MVKMYLLLKLIQVPWSIKTMLDFCILVWLVRIMASSSSVIFQFADTLYMVIVGLLFVCVFVYMCLRHV